MTSAVSFTPKQIDTLQWLYGSDVSFQTLQKNIQQWNVVLSKTLSQKIMSTIWIDNNWDTIHYEQLTNQMKIKLARVIWLSDCEKARVEHAWGDQQIAKNLYLKSIALHNHTEEEIVIIMNNLWVLEYDAWNQDWAIEYYNQILQSRLRTDKVQYRRAYSAFRLWYFMYEKKTPQSRDWIDMRRSFLQFTIHDKAIITLQKMVEQLIDENLPEDKTRRWNISDWLHPQNPKSLGDAYVFKKYGKKRQWVLNKKPSVYDQLTF